MFFLISCLFYFVLIFKIFMATNHKPVIKGIDYGIWQREGLKAPVIILNATDEYRGGKWTLSAIFLKNAPYRGKGTRYGLGSYTRLMPTGATITRNTPLANGFLLCGLKKWALSRAEPPRRGFGRGWLCECRVFGRFRPLTRLKARHIFYHWGLFCVPCCANLFHLHGCHRAFPLHPLNSRQGKTL